MTKFIAINFMNLVSPEAAAKHELLFINPASKVGIWTSKLDSSRAAKFDQIDGSQLHKFGHTWSKALVQSVTKFLVINFISLVTPEASAKHKLLFDRPLRDGFVERLSPTQVGKQCVTKFMVINLMSLVTPKAAAKHKLLLENPSELGHTYTYSQAWAFVWQPTLKWFCWTSKSDLSRTTKCDQIHDNQFHEFGHTYRCR